ncbi:MAG: FAD-dependent oxidoreductase [Candidatus Saccharibacteria bacterium]
MTHAYIVESVKQITATTLLLSLRQQEGERLFSFQPGQYASISFLKGKRPTPARCFSIMSSPTSQQTLQFGIRTKGRFTKAAARLMPGDSVTVSGPFGGFVLDLSANNDSVLLAGGIGVTPFISMARFATNVGTSNRLTLVYSCQTQYDIPFLGELLALEAHNPNFHVEYVIGTGTVERLPAIMSVNSGWVTAELLDSILASDYQAKMFYICGPPSYMKAIRQTLTAKSVPSSRILTEAFAQGSHHQTGKMNNWPYNIYAIGTASVVLASLTVAMSDLLKTLPPASLARAASLSPTLTSTNARQQDLDSLVNALPILPNAAPESGAVVAANQAAADAAASVAANGTTSLSAPSSLAKPSPSVPAPTPTPAPAPRAKVCTTTQSGVTTCV